jgi:hypothetical protein
MSKQDRVNMEDMVLNRVALPQAPVPIRSELEPADEAPRPVPVASPPVELPNSGIYTPASKNRDRLVTWSCRMPIRLREMLEKVADDYDTDMTTIVIDLLEMHLPKIPKKKR